MESCNALCRDDELPGSNSIVGVSLDSVYPASMKHEKGPFVDNCAFGGYMELFDSSGECNLLP